MFAVRLQSCADAATEDWRSPITVVQGGLDDTTHATNDTDDTNATNATSTHANASASSPVAENATSPGDTADAEPLPPRRRGVRSCSTAEPSAALRRGTRHWLLAGPVWPRA